MLAYLCRSVEYSSIEIKMRKFSKLRMLWGFMALIIKILFLRCDAVFTGNGSFNMFFFFAFLDYYLCFIVLI